MCIGSKHSKMRSTEMFDQNYQTSSKETYQVQVGDDGTPLIRQAVKFNRLSRVTQGSNMSILVLDSQQSPAKLADTLQPPDQEQAKHEGSSFYMQPGSNRRSAQKYSTLECMETNQMADLIYDSQNSSQRFHVKSSGENTNDVLNDILKLTDEGSGTKFAPSPRNYVGNGQGLDAAAQQHAAGSPLKRPRMNLKLTDANKQRYINLNDRYKEFKIPLQDKTLSHNPSSLNEGVLRGAMRGPQPKRPQKAERSDGASSNVL